MRSKIALGTAQFGLDYGINNKTGKVSKSEINKILDLAWLNNINFVDTAYLYGNSEFRLGEAIKINQFKFNIVSKLPRCTKNQIKEYFYKSLKRLNVNFIYGYLYHDFNSFINDETTYEELLILKDSRKVNKIGFSLYYPNELEFLLNKNIPFELLQIPYNLLDRRFGIYFKELNRKNIEIHTRSVFMQGLFFKNYKELGSKLSVFKNFLIKLNKFAKESDMNIDEIALGFALINEQINEVIVGIDNSKQLSRLINIEKNAPCLEEYAKINEIISEEKISEDLLLPSNWN